MRNIEDNISVLVENHFPQFYKEQGNTFIEFVKEYYKWLEQQDNTLYYSRNLLEYRDIDKTVDDFLKHFQTKYLAGSSVDIEKTRFNVKHSADLYTSKGTERGVKILIDRYFNTSDVSVNFPGKDIIKPSDGEWYVPTYLELTISEKSKDFYGKTIVGSVSGASAFVEGVGRKSINGKYIDVVFLSNIKGYFLFDELVTSDGDLSDCPRITGSLTKITLDGTGRNFVEGDVVDVVSQYTGKLGKARINEVEQTTGKVTFNLKDGGTGYRLTSNTSVAEKMLQFTDVVYSSTQATNFEYGEYIFQPSANIVFYSSNTSFQYGDLVTGANSTANVSTGRVLGKIQNTIAGTVTANTTSNTVVGVGTSFTSQIANNDYIRFQACTTVFQVHSVSSNTNLTLTSYGPNVTANTVTIANGSIFVTSLSGDWSAADRIYGSSALIGSYTNTTATGVVMGVNTTTIGLHSVENSFSANQYNFIYGQTSNVYANVSISGTGTAADFKIGSLTDEEVVYLNDDRVGANNSIPTSILTGSISCNTTSSQVNGTATSFTTELYSGAYIKIGSNNTVYQVNTITSDTVLNLTTNGRNATGNVFYITSGKYLTLPISALKYGFPENPSANLETIMSLALTQTSYSIGTIASLTGINPGSNYNISPFVKVMDEAISGYNRRNLHLVIDSRVGTFINGEELTQDFSEPAFTLQISGSNSSLSINETLTQIINATANAYGYVRSANLTLSVVGVSDFSNSSHDNTFINSTSTLLTGTVTSNATNTLVTGTGTTFTIDLSSGDFIKFSGNNLVFQVNTISNNTILNLTNNGAIVTSNSIYKIDNAAVGLKTGSKFFVNTAISNTQISLSKGTVISSGADYINVKRKTFNQSFTKNVPIQGSISGATANVVSVTQISSSSLMGNNAVINSTAGVVNGSIVSLSVIDSGYAYENGEVVSLEKEGSPYIATGYANLINQGTGEGYFTSTKGFLNSDKYIHDGYFYQFFSYQVSSGLPLDTYGDTLKNLMHVAGTKLFGNVNKVSNVNVTIKSSGAQIIT